VRPLKVDPDHTNTVGLDRDQARALLTAADTDTDTDTGPARPDCARPPRSGCCCTKGSGSTSSPAPAWPTSATTVATEP
jgi:hypothetical protein